MYALIYIISALLWAAPANAAYVLGPGDMVNVRVYQDDDMNVTLRVRPDGKLVLPLAGAVAVDGLTELEAAERIREKLAGDYYRDPLVNVEVTEFVANRAYVLGGVRKPGSYPIHAKDRVLDLVQRAGGMVGEGGGFAFIYDQNDAEGGAPAAVQRVSLTDILQSADFQQNVPVRSGATVYVGGHSNVFVMGAVKNPGAYQLTAGVTLLRALSLAGGPTPRANEEKVWIYRGTPIQGTQTNIEDVIDEQAEDPLLLPGDLVFVPQRFF